MIIGIMEKRMETTISYLRPRTFWEEFGNRGSSSGLQPERTGLRFRVLGF